MTGLPRDSSFGGSDSSFGSSVSIRGVFVCLVHDTRPGVSPRGQKKVKSLVVREVKENGLGGAVGGPYVPSQFSSFGP